MLILLFSFVAALLIALNFLYFLRFGEVINNRFIVTAIDIYTVGIAPFVFLFMADVGRKNECCGDSAIFSPGNSAGIYLLIAACAFTYFFTRYRKRPCTPVGELLKSCFLILGIILNVLIAIQLSATEFGAALICLGNLPVIGLFVIAIAEIHYSIVDRLKEMEPRSLTRIQTLARRALLTTPLEKYTILVLLLLPLLLVLSLFLLLFGQKPDSLIRAFTDTYKHGFSQLDHLCDNVQCGGHFLCSVAAKGHPKLVRPQRLGIRGSKMILCNRQLLVSNAFEELVQERIPWLHAVIRRQYNKVGNVVHRYYGVFNNKLVADLVYLLMKPLEWLFVVVLYAFDARPEDRIERQYCNWK